MCAPQPIVDLPTLLIFLVFFLKRPAQDRSLCLKDCKTARDTCCGSRCYKDPTWHNRCFGEFIGCTIKCPRADDEATNKVIDDFGNDTNEGARLRGHTIKPVVADN